MQIASIVIVGAVFVASPPSNARAECVAYRGGDRITNAPEASIPVPQCA